MKGNALAGRIKEKKQARNDRLNTYHFLFRAMWLPHGMRLTTLTFFLRFEQQSTDGRTGP